jgi:uncharacterized membrane protein
MTVASILFPAGTGLQSVGLALLIGGMLALGAFTAPVLFKQFARPEAGEAMMVIFRRFDLVVLAAVAMVVIGEILRLAASGIPNLTVISGFRYGLMILLVSLTLYSVMGVNARLENLQKAGMMQSAPEYRQDFQRLHKFSEQLYKAEMMAALLLLVLTPFAARGTQ